MAARRSRIAIELESRGFRDVQINQGKQRAVTFRVGRQTFTISRRQADTIRQQQPPGYVADDASTARTFARNWNRTHKTEIVARESLQNNDLKAAITILRADALRKPGKRTEQEAKQFAWAVKTINGKARVDFAGYMVRR